MFLLSSKNSTLTLFRHGTISKIVHPTSRLLVFHISFSPKKWNHMKPWDLFRFFFPMGPQALCAVGSPLSVSWFLPVEVSGIDLWSSFEVGGFTPNPPSDGESNILWIFLGTPSLIIGAYHVHVLFMRVPSTYISRNSFILLTRSASTGTGASTVLLGIFRFALVLPVKAKSWKDHIQRVYLNVKPIVLADGKNWSLCIYLSSLGSLR